VLYTFGFVSAYDRNSHFDKHVLRRREFTFVTSLEYESHADVFLGGSCNADTSECFRTNSDGTTGDKIRYNRVTQEFGVLDTTNHIRSYFKPSPSRHGKSTNEIYFNDECDRMMR
jgi:hypothetical protein